MKSVLCSLTALLIFSTAHVANAATVPPVGVAAKLGCAVEYACLTAHEQRPHAMLPDRRKDFEYRVAYQANHQGRSKLATTFLIRASALAVTGDTTKPILRRRFLQA